jgi:hypothetical protein
MPSFELKPTSIALFPTAADRSTLIPNPHQQHYLSPPLTPYSFPAYSETHEPNPPIESPFLPSLPTFREMLPHEDRRQTPPLDPERHVYPLPVLQHHSEHDVTALAEHNSASTLHGSHHISDPARLLPLYSVQPHAASLSSSLVSPLLRRNKAHVASACVNCKKAHLACDGNSPSVYQRAFLPFSPTFRFIFALRWGRSGCMTVRCTRRITQSTDLWVCAIGGVGSGGIGNGAIFLECIGHGLRPF